MITAIDTHRHIHYGAKETLVYNSLSNLMQESDFYSAYPEILQQISKYAHITKVFASPFDGVLDCLAESPSYLRRKYPKNLDFSYAFS